MPNLDEKTYQLLIRGLRAIEAARLDHMSNAWYRFRRCNSISYWLLKLLDEKTAGDMVDYKTAGERVDHETVWLQSDEELGDCMRLLEAEVEKQGKM